MGSQPVGFEVSAYWLVLAAGLHAPTQKEGKQALGRCSTEGFQAVTRRRRKQGHLQVWLCTGVALREYACVG
jgi:hypothetical protein